MSISLDLLVVIIINVMTAGIFIGGLAMSIKFIENQIKRLEEKQDKHNCLIERMVKVEERAKSAHKRIDKIENNDNHNEIHST
ncbi:hypothetical protein IJ384_02795 [bacterium]|nr:hypothetical protein [bacterium]